jgi:hypothetical protein
LVEWWMDGVAVDGDGHVCEVRDGSIWWE